MQSPEHILDAIARQAFLPLFFSEDQQLSLEISRVLYAGGVRLIEYTNRGSAALDNFRALKREAEKSMPDLILSAGTIKTPLQARQFIDAGADFIIAPVINPDVADVVHAANLLWIPGCMTPTEIYQAESCGARLVKIFPGNIVGPAFISAVKELFPTMKFMPTGGVELDEQNIRSWFNAGVFAVGLGSKLIDKTLLQTRDTTRLKAQLDQAVSLLEPYRKK